MRDALRRMGMAGVLALLAATGALASDKPGEPPEGPTVWEPAVKPKALSASVKKGLAWLVKTQMKSGAWSQGEESSAMGGRNLGAPSVADTCVAALALLRAGNTPSKGEYAANLRRAVEFLCSEIEASDEKSLYITKHRNTRVQMKLGTYIDTFMASMLLAEVQDHMPDEKSTSRVATALDKVLDKVSRNQRKDGSWDDKGWAPTLAEAMAIKGLNRAAQAGAKVSGEVLKRAEQKARTRFDSSSGRFDGKGSAGVDLYAGASALGSMQDSENTNVAKEKQARYKIANGASDAEKQAAREELRRIEANRRDLQAAKAAIEKKLGDRRFIAGFGSNGGEEFLSYLNIGESLVVKGGEAWEKFDGSMTKNMSRIQNKDGSWTGHHCITGRTFCTSAALLVLMTDRAPVPVAGGMKKR